MEEDVNLYLKEKYNNWKYNALGNVQRDVFKVTHPNFTKAIGSEAQQHLCAQNYPTMKSLEYFHAYNLNSARSCDGWSAATHKNQNKHSQASAKFASYM